MNKIQLRKKVCNIKNKNENRLTVQEAARLMGTSEQSIRVGMQTGALNIGFCIKNSSVYTYIIPTEKFTKETGIQVDSIAR